MRTTITLDDRLLRAAKRYAADRGTTVSAVIDEALRAKLAAPAPRSVRPFRLVTFRGRGPREGIDLDRTSELLERDDVEAHAQADHRAPR
jgi:hypothetical protein